MTTERVFPLLPGPNAQVAAFLATKSDTQVLGHFVGQQMLDAPVALNEAAIVCIDMEWYQKDPKPLTEIGIAELMRKHEMPLTHAENFINGIKAAHARLIPNAHLLNNFAGAGNAEDFSFGITKFVDFPQAKDLITTTFVRRTAGKDTLALQPIIVVGHAVDNEFDQLNRIFGVDLTRYGCIVRILDTQVMAKEAGIRGPRGPNIGLGDLLKHFNIHIDNLHTAGNDAAGTLMAAVLITLKNVIYPGYDEALPATIDGCTMQAVIQRTMMEGKASPAPDFGTELYCTRCDRTNHLRQQCFANVECSICRDSGVIRLYNARRTHKTVKCLYQYQNMPQPDRGYTIQYRRF